MVWFIPTGVALIYASLACATVKPPPGQPVPVPTVAGAPVVPPAPSTRPAWDIIGTCTALNEAGVQTYPSLNPR